MLVFEHPSFLSNAECRQIRKAMDRAPREPGEVLTGDTVAHRQDIRRVSSLEVDDDTIAFVERRLDAQRAAVDSRFALPLDAREGSGFLRYQAGGFYAPHRDRGHVPAWPDAARRRVALVAFLNDGFTGGQLRLFLDQPDLVTIEPRAGLLVAFPADALHEVTPVEEGIRDAVVDWFY